MSGILMMVIAIVVLGGAYLLYYMAVICKTNGALIQMPRLLPTRWRTEWTMYRPIPM